MDMGITFKDPSTIDRYMNGVPSVASNGTLIYHGTKYGDGKDGSVVMPTEGMEKAMLDDMFYWDGSHRTFRPFTSSSGTSDTLVYRGENITSQSLCKPVVWHWIYDITDVKYSKSERTGKTTTIVFFEDGSKETAVPSDGEEFDPVVGINMCILKRLYGNRSQLKKIYKKFVPDYKQREREER